MWGYVYQLGWGTLVTLALALSAAGIGLILGLIGGTVLSFATTWPRYIVTSLIFLIRGLPEILILFFIYFGLSALLTHFYHHYIDVSPFIAGVAALSLIFAAYASHVFHGAALAIEAGQVEAAIALGLNAWQMFYRIQLPQLWRYAIPGLGNLWLILLKDTAIVMLIGLSDLMSQAKFATSATHQPFTFYLLAALIYLLITYVSQKFVLFLKKRARLPA